MTTLWTEKFVCDVALMPDSAEKIAYAHANAGLLEWDDWLTWKDNPAFWAAVEAKKVEFSDPSTALKTKATMLVEASLAAMFQIANNPTVDPEARIKAFDQLKSLAGAAIAPRKNAGDPSASDASPKITFNMGAATPPLPKPAVGVTIEPNEQ